MFVVVTDTLSAASSPVSVAGFLDVASCFFLASVKSFNVRLSPLRNFVPFVAASKRGAVSNMPKGA